MQDRGFARVVVGSMVELTGGGTLDVDLKTGGTASITGTLLDEAPLPPLVRVGAAVFPDAAGGSEMPGPIREAFAHDGRFTFPALPPGHYMLMAGYGEGDDGPGPIGGPLGGTTHYGHIEVTVDEGEDATVTIQLSAQ